jgi:hypothetical protein
LESTTVKLTPFIKTQEAIVGKVGEPRVIGPSLREFEALVADEVGAKS